MKQKAKTPSLHLSTVALAVGLLTLAPAAAADLTWTGTTNANWSGANWNGGTAADSGVDKLFFAGTTNLSTNNDLVGYTAAGVPAITFLSGAGAFTLSGNSISLSGNITNSSSNLQTINLGLALVSSSTFTAGAGGGNLTVGGIISGANGVTVTGPGIITLSGSNTYSGSTTLVGTTTTLRVGHNSALGTGTVDLGAAVTMQAEGADITLANSGVFITPIFSGSQSLTFTGKLIANNGSRRITNNISAGKSLTLTDLDISSTDRNRNLELLGSGDTKIIGTIANGGTATASSLTNNTTGVTTLSGTNTYNGTTTVSNGTLVISGGGSINSSSGVSIGGTSSRLRYDSTVGLNRTVAVTTGGTFIYNSASNYTGAFTFTSGHLGGSNWNGSLGNLTIGADQTINPGNSPGTAITTSQTWASLGTYNWEINQATGGTAGNDPGWDLLELSGTLSLTATEASRFEIHIVSLKLDNTAGDAVGFDAALSYQWLIADAANPILGFSADKFFINTADFSNTFDGSFGVALGNTGGIGGDDSQLYLVYTAVPEPGVVGLLGLAGLGALAVRRRRA